MFLSHYARLRQWSYPKEFRIPIQESDSEIAVLIRAVSQAVSIWGRNTEVALDPTAREPNVVDSDEEKRFIVALCNQYFRLKQFVDDLFANEPSREDLHRLLGVLEMTRDAFAVRAIECVDLSGQDYDEGRSDFEKFGDLEKRADLTKRVILECERPAVLRSGEVLQRAKGTVGTPA